MMIMMGFFFQILSGKKMELLPGDRDSLAIQTRGGPEKHEVTGWVLVSTNTMLCHCCSGTNQNRPWFVFQISPLTKEEEGSYECHATNAKGEASAVGAIHVVESIDELTARKGNI